jgi:hypothetical protein
MVGTDMANGPFIRGSEVPVKHPQTIALLTGLGAPDLLSAEDDDVPGGKRSLARPGRRTSGQCGAPSCWNRNANMSA